MDRRREASPLPLVERGRDGRGRSSGHQLPVQRSQTPLWWCPDDATVEYGPCQRSVPVFATDRDGRATAAVHARAQLDVEARTVGARDSNAEFKIQNADSAQCRAGLVL